MRMKTTVCVTGVLAAMFLGCVVSVFAADPCDRECLESYIDQVLDAMMAHNPNRLMLEKDVRYTENGVELRLGDGMWGTLSGRGKYNIYISDPEVGEAGFQGTVNENGGMNYIALRVKVFEALIREIEALVVRPEGMMDLDKPPVKSKGDIMDEKTPRLQFLQTVPMKQRMSRAELIKTANSYFMGLANQTGNFTAPFAETCERLENGIHTTNRKPDPNLSEGALDILSMSCEEQQKSGWFAFVTEIHNRRFPIVDVERGLVLAFGFFDHNAAVREYPLPNNTMTPNVLSYPQTIQIAELFQIGDGKIDQIEAVINTVPYRMKSEVWDK